MKIVEDRGLLLVEIEVPLAHAEELDRWYAEIHIPEKLSRPEYLSVRRYQSAEREDRFLAVYELADHRAALLDYKPSPSMFGPDDIRSRLTRMDREVWRELE